MSDASSTPLDAVSTSELLGLKTFKKDLPLPEIPEGADISHDCLPISVAMILKRDNNTVGLDKLRTVSRKRANVGTWPGFMASWLQNQGYLVEVRGGFDWGNLAIDGEGYLESGEFKLKHDPDGKLKTYVEVVGIPEGIAASKEMVAKGIYKSGEIGFEEVLKRAAEGEDAIVVLDGDHWVPITGYDGQTVYYNNPNGTGVEKDRPKDLQRFREKWEERNIKTVIFLKKPMMSTQI